MAEAAHGMRPLTDLLAFDEARDRVLAACRPVAESEEIDLVEAAGRVLAETLEAAADVPAFDRAAMDGYALRAADAREAGARLHVVGRVHAGPAGRHRVGAGECVQIATGAPLPEGADAVVAVERTRSEGTHVTIERPIRPRENVSARGSDLRQGARVLETGALLTPARIAVAAALGRARLRVWRRARVAVLSTGSELRPPGVALRPGEIHDSNGPGLVALLSAQGAEVTLAERVEDDVALLRKALKGAVAMSDMVVLSGSSSAGEHDLLRDAVAAEGRIAFHGVRVKPGKPLLLGEVATKTVLGLPGYPTSCLSDAYLFLVPALRRVARHPEEPVRRVTARLGLRVEGVRDRVWFVPVRLEAGLAVPTYKESGATTSLSDAVGYVTVPPDVAFLDEGEAVEVVLF
jgi:molybdopterin molybdotransferase